jgi:hypothetical protein
LALDHTNHLIASQQEKSDGGKMVALDHCMTCFGKTHPVLYANGQVNFFLRQTSE